MQSETTDDSIQLYYALYHGDLAKVRAIEKNLQGLPDGSWKQVTLGQYYVVSGKVAEGRKFLFRAASSEKADQSTLAWNLLRDSFNDVARVDAIPPPGSEGDRIRRAVEKHFGTSVAITQPFLLRTKATHYRLPLEVTPTALFIYATINGERYKLQLDTGGVGYTILYGAKGKRVLPVHSVPTAFGWITGPAYAQQGIVNGISFGSMKVDHVNVTFVEKAPVGAAADGLISATLFKQFLLTFNLTEKILLLEPYPNRAFVLQGPTAPFTNQLPLYQNLGCLFVPCVSICGTFSQTGYATVDTGSAFDLVPAVSILQAEHRPVDELQTLAAKLDPRLRSLVLDGNIRSKQPFSLRLESTDQPFDYKMTPTYGSRLLELTSLWFHFEATAVLGMGFFNRCKVVQLNLRDQILQVTYR